MSPSTVGKLHGGTAGDSSPKCICICTLPSEVEPGDTVRGLSSSMAPRRVGGHPVPG